MATVKPAVCCFFPTRIWRQRIASDCSHPYCHYRFTNRSSICAC